MWSKRKAVNKVMRKEKKELRKKTLEIIGEQGEPSSNLFRVGLGRWQRRRKKRTKEVMVHGGVRKRYWIQKEMALHF